MYYMLHFEKVLAIVFLLSFSTMVEALPTFKSGDTLTAQNLNELAVAISNPSINSGLGESQKIPAVSCSDLHTQRMVLADGVYWVQPPSSNTAFRVYCDMTTDGGGWTLVWSNLRGGRGKIVTELQYIAAINTSPRYRGEPSLDLESFEVFVGLKHWVGLANNVTMSLRYDWSVNYQQDVSETYTCDTTLDSANQYTINFDLPTCQGTTRPGMVSVHNGSKFSAYDRDNDSHATDSCSIVYGRTPWWFATCFNGGIMGGGESSTSANTAINGAYWTGSLGQWATTSSNSEGAGNGWLYIRAIQALP